MWPYVSDYRGKHAKRHMYQTTEVNMSPYVSDYRGKHVAICIRLQR